LSQLAFGVNNSQHHGKGATMSVRRMILLGGVILLLVGAIGLLAPLSASTNDGKEIGCGSGLFQDLDKARSANASSVAGVPILN